ncbi:hypothetical protein D3C84_387410 [compost metagenome]
MRKQLEVLEHHASLLAQAQHALARQVMGEVEFDPPQHQSPRIRPLQQIHAAQQGTLAAAGGTDQRGDAARRQRETDPLQHPLAAKLLLDTTQPDHGATSRVSLWVNLRSSQSCRVESTELNSR